MGGKRRALGRASEDDDKSLGLRLVVNHFCLRSSSLASGSLTFSQGLWTLGYSRTLGVKQRPRECPRPGLRARVTKVRPKSFSLGLCAHRPALAGERKSGMDTHAQTQHESCFLGFVVWAWGSVHSWSWSWTRLCGRVRLGFRPSQLQLKEKERRLPTHASGTFDERQIECWAWVGGCPFPFIRLWANGLSGGVC